MPSVRGKNKKTKRGSAAQGGLMERTGATLDNFFQRAIRLVITYTAVSVAGVFVVLILMMFAGGYFFNIGSRVSNLGEDMARGVGFEVQRVTMKGAVQTSNGELLSALYSEQKGQIIGRALPQLNLGDLKENVEEIGWVKNAAVSRLWPGTIHVSIVERTPIAVWQQTGNGELFLLDTDGVTIEAVGGHEYAQLPMVLNSVRPMEAAKILKTIKQYPSLAGKIAAVKEQGNRRWDLVFRNGFVVKLPAENYEKVIYKLTTMENEKSTLSDKLEYLDVRDSRTVYYRPKT